MRVVLAMFVVLGVVVVFVLCDGNSHSGGSGDVTGLKLTDNGYDGVVIRIGDHLAENWCSSIIHGIERVINRASNVLYRATRRRAFFRSVTVILPAHWSPSVCPRTVNTTAPPFFEPAITIGRQHPVYGHTPWTLQVAGCGKPGRTIYITPQYLAFRNFSDSLGDPGRVLVQEWAKYRWGVFEEYGHAGDPLYPAFHRTPTQSHTPTGCSNVPVQGSPVQCSSHRESSCRFEPSTSGNDEVTSSLMYLHHLPHVTEFCDGSSHSPTSPTKHNALCSHRSVWDVIEQHSDFANGSNPPGDATRDVTTSFTYVHPAPARYVIVVEDTTVMNIQKRWEFLRKAVRKLLVYDVPVGSAVGVVLFDQVAYTNLPLTPTPASLDERQRLATSSLPRNPSRIPQSQKCIICGLQEAVKMLELEGASAAGRVILLITAGSPLPLTPYDIEQLEAVVNPRGVRVVPVLYPVTGRNPQPAPGIETLAHSSGTQFFAVLDEGIGSDSKVSMMVALMDALYAALRIFIPDPNTLPIVVHKKEFPGGIGSISQGAFTIDESLGGQVRFALTYYDLGHVGNMINLIDPKGMVLESLNLQEEDGDVNMIFLTVKNAMAGEWRYRVENRADSHQSLFVRVLATPGLANGTSNSGSSSYHRDSHAVTLTAWTSSTSALVNISDLDHPVLVYAQVSCGGAPVVGVKVEASLQRLGANSTGSPYLPKTFLLFDNGNGDADITKNDGVYSRYLPVVDTSDARYTLSFTLTDNDGAAQVIMSAQPSPSTRPRMYVSNHLPYSPQMSPSSPGIQYARTRPYNPPWPRCCGSLVPYSTARPTGQLSRTVTVGVIDIVGGRRSQMGIPPSRIGDFRAEINPAAQHVTFYWTAPGSRRDHDRVAHYEVVFSRDAASTAQGSGETATEWSEPFLVGTSSSHTVIWRRHDGVYYFAIRGVNQAHEPGPWSNTVEIFMPHPPTTTEINTRGSTQGGPVGGTVGELGVTTPQPSILSTRDILAIVGAACVILVIILLMAVYYLIVVTRKKRHQQEKKAIEVLEPATTTPAGCETDSDTNSITKPPPPLPEAVADGEAEVTGKRSLSPIQSWPASTLLAEHERRRPNDSTDGEGGEVSLHHPDLGVPYMPTIHPVHPHPFYYHTPNGHYIEDNLAMDSGSMVSTQPSESLLAYKVDTSVSDIRPPSSSVSPTPVSWEGGQRPGPMKVPPPTPPKPTLAAHLTLGGVAASPMGTERKRRNVTQV